VEAGAAQWIGAFGYEASVFDPEAFRTPMALRQPAVIGLGGNGDAVMARFQLSPLTEGREHRSSGRRSCNGRRGRPCGARSRSH
jgi:hypothetical protein